MTHCFKLLRTTKSSLLGGRLLLPSTSSALDGVRCLSSPTPATAPATAPGGVISRVWGRDSNTGSEGTSRWRMLAPAMLTHLSLGAPYGWSALSGSLTREFGFVGSSGADWSLELVTYPMSIILGVGGASAFLFSRLQVRLGVRASMLAGAFFFGSGLMLSSVGVAQHSLPLLYTGNVLAGLGYGAAYTPPVQAVISWFPDRKGLGTGLVIGAFGSGAIFFTPMVNCLTYKLSTLPTYLGSSAEIVLENGRQFALVCGEMKEVVYATTADLATLPYQDLVSGYYVVGSGNTGVSASLAIMATGYFSSIFLSSLLMKCPPPGHLPPGYSPPSSSRENVPVENLLKTPQFWLVWSQAVLLASGGMSLLSVGQPMIETVFRPLTQNIMGDVMPAFITLGNIALGGGYLMAIAAGNLLGRIGWASLSDKIGSRKTFTIMSVSAIPLYAITPFLISQAVRDPSSPLAPLYFLSFSATTVACVSIMGGLFSSLPPYETELYGAKYVGPIHGKFLLFGTAATFLGPSILQYQHRAEETRAVQELLQTVDPSLFLSKFGVGVEEAQSLLEAKTLTLSKLMTIMPPGTIDPSPFLYNSTLYTMAGLASLATVLHFSVSPVDRKYFRSEPEEQKSDQST